MRLKEKESRKLMMGVVVMSDELLTMAEGQSIVAAQREGLVFKSNERNKYHEIVHFKAISNKWLLKNED